MPIVVTIGTEAFFKAWTNNIRELAKHLNISIGTVSRALNGRPYVDAATRERVLAAAAEFGYSPNFAGRSLRHGATGMVGMMMPTSNGLVAADQLIVVKEGAGIQKGHEWSKAYAARKESAGRDKQIDAK